MLIVNQVAERITDFTIPDMHAIEIEAQAGEMRDILVNSVFEIDTQLFSRPVSMGKRGGIVDAESGDFLPVFTPMHTYISVNGHLVVYLLSLSDTERKLKRSHHKQCHHKF